jgi:hypothetical protein
VWHYKLSTHATARLALRYQEAKMDVEGREFEHQHGNANMRDLSETFETNVIATAHYWQELYGFNPRSTLG